jgi:PAS domain S-box-containing protein
MKDQKKTKRQLIDELVEMRQRVAELEAAGTERLQAGEAIEVGEEKYRSLVESTEDSVYLVDQRGTYLFLNKKYQARLDLPEDQVVGKPYGEFHSEKETREFAEKLKRVFETSGPVQYEHTSERDGRSFLRTLSPVRDQEGQVTTVTVISKDISERKRAETALQESEQLLSITLRSIGGAMIATDAKGLVTLMHPVAEDLTGWDEAEAVGKPLEDVFSIINEQTGERAENPVARVLREGVVVGLANHTVLIARDGTTRPIADSGAPMRDEEGNIIGTVMVFRDITERRRLEKAVQEEREYAESIVETVREPLVVLDADLRVISANRSFLQGFQVTVEETAGQLIYDLGNRQWDIPKLRELLEGILPKNTTFDDYEVEHDFETIGHRTMLLNGRRLYREANKTQMILLAIEDMTERRRAEQELREAQEELIRKERLAILGQLASGVGHDLRNPLGAIKNAAYFLNMVLEEPDPEVKETLEILKKEVGTSEAIISSLLDFARPKPPTKRKTGISRVLQEALARTAVPNNIEVLQEISETLPEILADPDQLGRVFGNIILNGIQAMTEGGQLTIKSEAPAPGRVSVSITDTGAGIPEEQLEKLFEPLYTTKAKGVGLGLAIVKTLVEGHGGTVEVESEIGRGSVFTVRLPINREEGA